MRTCSFWSSSTVNGRRLPARQFVAVRVSFFFKEMKEKWYKPRSTVPQHSHRKNRINKFTEYSKEYRLKSWKSLVMKITGGRIWELLGQHSRRAGLCCYCSLRNEVSTCDSPQPPPPPSLRIIFEAFSTRTIWRRKAGWLKDSKLETILKEAVVN
jgi:hypothetical protein